VAPHLNDLRRQMKALRPGGSGGVIELFGEAAERWKNDPQYAGDPRDELVRLAVPREGVRRDGQDERGGKKRGRLCDACTHRGGRSVVPVRLSRSRQRSRSPARRQPGLTRWS
jgi:hypothetical protein